MHACMHTCMLSAWLYNYDNMYSSLLFSNVATVNEYIVFFTIIIIIIASSLKNYRVYIQ